MGEASLIYGIDNGNLNYQDAFDFAYNYSTEDYSDWRFPTQAESEEIIEFVVEMAIDNGQLYTGTLPPDTPDAYTIPFWTSTEMSETAHVTVAWDGTIPQAGEHDDVEQCYAFAVRTVVMTD